MRDLIDKVLGWGDDRGLLVEGNLQQQTLKMVAEVGEVADEVAKGDKNKAMMELGDVLVTTIFVAWQLGVHIEDCLDLAYEKISRRTGKLVNGVFVKD